jgi:hypothetical protein
LELGAPNEVYLFAIDYDEARQNVLLDDITKWLIELYLKGPGLDPRPPDKEWAEELVFFWLSNVSSFAVGVKHVAFAAEQEWRLFQYCRAEEKTKFQFRQRASFMSRHLPLRLPKLPIVSVRIGPVRHPQLSRIAVADLLIKHGYSLDSVSIEVSEVPYRQS